MRITKGGRYTGLISNVIASGVTFDDTGGYFGGGQVTLDDILNLIGAGAAPGSFLTTTLGGQGTVQALGTLGATETIDLANANKFWGTLDQDCTITTVGWTNLKDVQISVELIQNGTGGWTPTFTGVTWIGGTPTWVTTAGTVTHVVLFSRDGGTTIYGAVVGGGSTTGALTVINGGGGTVQAHGNLGSTETIDTANGNYHWGTLNANCTFTFTTTVDTAERWFTLELIEDGTGGWTVTWPGSVVWLGGSTPVHTTTAGTTTIYAFFTRNGGTTWIGGQLGGSIMSFATPAVVLGTAAAAGVATTAIRSDSTIVAFDATVPAALGTAATGAAAVAARRDHVHPMVTGSDIDDLGHWEVLMASGISSPPEPLENGDGSDWLYTWVPG
jgi:hypothetical protein